MFIFFNLFTYSLPGVGVGMGRLVNSVLTVFPDRKYPGVGGEEGYLCAAVKNTLPYFSEKRFRSTHNSSIT